VNSETENNPGGPPASQMVVRTAFLNDARTIHELINTSAAGGEMLPRSLNDVYESLRDFVVAEAEDGRIVGVCALHLSWAGWAEIRSLVVLPELRGRGMGRGLGRACLTEAARLGVDRVFTLTYLPDFFRPLGFRLAEKGVLPQKVWGDCLNCPKFPDCDELALVRDVPSADSESGLPAVGR